MRRLPAALLRFLNVVLALVLLASGVLKLSDPVGTGLIVTEYFKFFHISVGLGFAKIFGCVLAYAEVLTGAALIMGLLWKWVAMWTFVLFGFFTVLTLILLIFNPNMDCGCFGEAIHLSHVESFAKNVVLCGLAFLLLRFWRGEGRKNYSGFAIIAVLMLALGVYSWKYLPPEDFTAFAAGEELYREGNAEEKDYEAVFVYAKNGEERAFGLDDLPDETWHFVRTERLEAAKEGAFLSFWDGEGEYADSLAFGERVLLLSIYDQAKLRKDDWERLGAWVQGAGSAGFEALVLVAGGRDEKARSEFADDVGVYYADYKTLVSLNRANAGVTWLSEGMIVRKWAFGNLPDREDLAGLSSVLPLEEMAEHNTRSRMAFHAFLLLVLCIVMFFRF